MWTQHIGMALTTHKLRPLQFTHVSRCRDTLSPRSDKAEALR